MAETVKNLPATQETWIQSPNQEGPLKKGMALHSSILAWRFPWTEAPGGLQSMGHKESYMTEQLSPFLFCTCAIFFFVGGGGRWRGGCAACGILVSQLEMEPMPPALEAQNLNHCTVLLGSSKLGYLLWTVFTGAVGALKRPWLILFLWWSEGFPTSHHSVIMSQTGPAIVSKGKGRLGGSRELLSSFEHAQEV